MQSREVSILCLLTLLHTVMQCAKLQDLLPLLVTILCPLTLWALVTPTLSIVQA